VRINSFEPCVLRHCALCVKRTLPNLVALEFIWAHSEERKALAVRSLKRLPVIWSTKITQD